MMTTAELHVARVTSGELHVAKLSFQFLTTAMKDTVSKHIVFRSGSPSEAWTALDSPYSSSTTGAGVDLYQQSCQRGVQSGY